jgi:hypothetical protein
VCLLFFEFPSLKGGSATKRPCHCEREEELSIGGDWAGERERERKETQVCVYLFGCFSKEVRGGSYQIGWSDSRAELAHSIATHNRTKRRHEREQHTWHWFFVLLFGLFFCCCCSWLKWRINSRDFYFYFN